MTVTKISEIHDSKFRSIALSEKHTELIFTFEIDNGAQKRILFSGVRQMRIVDFWQENTVSRAIIYTGQSENLKEIKAHVE